MDILTGVEPQLAVPVVAVVVLAILVYIFGFQQTQEPSMQHLAVLHSGSKSNKSSSNVTNKQKNQGQNSSSGQKGGTPKGKALSNGHVQNKEKKVEKVNNKENVKPAQVESTTPKATKKEAKKAENKPEEVDAGEWIPAVSRKDKKLRPKKEDIPSEPVTPKSKKANASKAVNTKAVLKEIEVAATPVIEETKVLPASPLDKNKKKKTPAPASTPVVSADAPVKKQVEEKLNAPSIIEAKADDDVKETEKKLEKEEIKIEVKPTKAPSDEPKSNVAFDEMGDMWEEAKSRGAKKKRARKD